MTTQSSSHPQDSDPFDTLLTLEDTLYTTAYTQGAADGARAGRIEGRIFGLEKGFEKFAAMGILHGRACVWGSRLPSEATSTKAENQTRDTESVESIDSVLPPLSTTNPRLTKNIALLHGLTDPFTFSTSNTEESVADFDDRFKRAGAKAKIIERTIGENAEAMAAMADASSQGGEQDKTRSPKKGTVRRVKVTGEGKKEDSMEDFAGSRLLG